MTRIGMVIGQLTLGGAERQLYETCIRLGDHGIDPVVYCLSNRTEPYGPLLEAAKIPVESIERGSHFDFRRAGLLRRAARRDGAAALHAWLIDDNPYAFAASIGGGRRFIASLRSRPLDRDPIRRGIDRFVFRKADRVVANSAEVGEHLERVYGLKPDRIEVIENGVDLARLKATRPFEATRESLSTPPDSFVLLFLGRLHAVKRIPFLLDAFKGFSEEVSDATLWIVGEGEERSALEDSASRLGVSERVRFAGARSDVGDLYRSADILVLCSESEGLPNAAVEAMVCGLPVLATPESGCRDIIRDGENGWISEGAALPPFIAKLKQIKENPEFRKSLGKAASESAADRFSMDRMVGRMVKIYRGIGIQ